jgi:hypothetical protein
LDRDGKKFIPGFDWGEIRKWWLAYPHPKANTPNWDIAAVSRIGFKPGMVLVEAKAHDEEFVNSKSPKEMLSTTSVNNRLQIMRAIYEASDALAPVFPGLDLLQELRSGFADRVDLCSHYQLSNRVAFSWKLASMGLPVVLVYLGFVGDHGIVDRRIERKPLEDESHWRVVFTEYALPVFGSAFLENILEEKPINCGNASMTILLRSKSVLEESPPSASQFLYSRNVR